MNRTDKLMPDGIPRWIRCYDNGGETIDRFTVVFTGRYRHLTGGETVVLNMSESPYRGFCQHGNCRPHELMEGNKRGQWPPAIGRTGNLGRRIAFVDLPNDCQEIVRKDYIDLWDIEDR